MKRTRMLALTVSVLTLGACADDGDSSGTKPDGGASPGGKPIYQITTAVYRPDGLDVYVNLTNEVDFTKIDLTKARQFPAYTGIRAVAGAIFAADGTSPNITKYDVTDDLQWIERDKLNFSAYPLDPDNYMNFYFQSFKDDDNVYFFYGQDKTGRVVWSPKEFKIKGQYADTKLPAAGPGESLGNGGNRTDMKNFVGPVVQPFNKYVEATDSYGPQSWLAVYDPTTYAERSVIEAPCPGIAQVTKDEQGNLYFSPTHIDEAKPLYGVGPASCVVKVKSDGTVDQSFGFKDFKSLTGGRYGTNFRYLKDGKALALVLHHERLQAEYKAPVDPAVAEKLDTDAKLWELELVDLATSTSKLMTGLKPEHDIGNYLITVGHDGRTFIVLQLDDEMSKSALYEAKPDGTLTWVADTVGEIWGVERVR